MTGSRIGNCSNCSAEINLGWRACNICGTPIVEGNVNCTRCFALIPLDSKFCPFCTADQQIKAVITPRPAMKTKKVDKILLLPHQEKLTRKTVTSSLRFDTDSTVSIVSNESFSTMSTLLIVVSSLFFALTFLLVEAIFGEGGTVKEGIKLFIQLAWGHMMVLFGAVVFTKLVFESVEVHTGLKINSRYFGLWSITLIVKDLFIYPTMIYVYIFEGKEGLELVQIIFTTLTILIVIFLAIHAVVYYRSMTGYGYSLCLLLFATTAIMVWLFTIYNTMFIRAVVDNF
ncbi:MAG: zinc ribbon domain-containing protein [Candidatus Heimdallarchaeota archaeon]|nr:zinc ribbon domain-containing protein [Candidatus Heimdallarchaeota archaeon]